MLGGGEPANHPRDGSYVDILIDDNPAEPGVQFNTNFTELPFSSKDLACLLSELATGWKAGSGFHSAFSRLASPDFYREIAKALAV